MARQRGTGLHTPAANPHPAGAPGPRPADVRHHQGVADELHIRGRLAIPMKEILVRASRSGGPGGQHANVTASRIEVVWDVRESEAVSDAERTRILERLGPVITAVAQDSRSQRRNRDLALDRLGEKVRGALVVQQRRVATKPTRGSKERRLTAKRQASDRKANRRRPGTDD